MAFPATPTLDDLQRANETPIAGGWGTAAPVNGDYRVNLESSTMVSANGLGTGSAFWNTAFSNDNESWIVLDSVGDTGAQYWVMVRGNGTGAGHTGYWIMFQKYATITVYKCASATFTQIAQFTGVTGMVNGSTVGARMVGSDLRVYVDGVEKGQVTDATYATGTKIGTRIFGNVAGRGPKTFGGGSYAAAVPLAVFFDPLVNFGYSTITAAPTPAVSGTSFSVADPGAFLDPATFGAYNVTVWPAGTIPTRTNAELFRVLQKAGAALLGNRSQEGTSARTVVVGDQVAHTFSAKFFTDLIARLGPSVTRKYGATSVADGGTITHGCGATPDVVIVTPSVASQMASVTAKSSTTFTVALKTDAGAAGTTQTVYWEALILNAAASG